MSSWSKKHGIGRVVLGKKPPGNTAALVQKGLPLALKLRAKRKALGLPTIIPTPATGHRKSKYASSMANRKPKHPRVRLRETVAKEARDIQDMARRHATAAMERMAHIVNNPASPENAQIAAAAVILDRAYGRPNQTNTNLNVDANGKPTEVSTTELDRRIAEALRAVEALTGRARQAPKGKEQPADIRERDRNPDGSEPQLH
jgi:hypothetical protein